MGFDIAIYNGLGWDDKKLLHSVKAAYLYADKVRVYNTIATNIRGIDIINQLKERVAEGQFDKAEMDKRPYLWDLDDLSTYIARFSSSFYIEKMHSDVIKMLNSAVLGDWGTEKHSESMDNIDWFIFYCLLQEHAIYLKTLPEKVAEQRKFVEMGIEVIEPTFDTSVEIPDITHSIADINNRILEDDGFKVLNDSSTLRTKKNEPSSMLVSAALSYETISSLPGFEEASLDEIIDIRKELNRYIINYRSAMLDMSQKINEIPDTKSFQEECKTIYLRDIEPQVESINTAIRDNNVFKNIGKNIATNKQTWLSIGALTAAFFTSGNMASALNMGAAIGFGGSTLANSVVSAVKEKNEIKKNKMFFLYEVGKKFNDIKTSRDLGFVYGSRLEH